MLATDKDLSPVTAALVKLQELAHRMSEPRFHFAKLDVDNVAEIMQCIQDLEAERLKAHEVLEAESIKANVLRHRLREYPLDTGEELENAVRAARQLNADVINNLRKQIQEINESIASMMEKVKQLQAYNAKMLAEKQQLQSTHDKCIVRLNEVLTEKARRTIKLNETRDSLKRANTRIVQLEEDSQQLQDDLIQERIDHREEIKRLRKETSVKSDKRDIQKVQNEQKKRELLAIEGRVKDSDQFLVELKDSLNQYESSKVRLEAEAGKLEKELDDRIEFGKLLAQQLNEWEEKSKVLKDEFELASKVLKMKITAIEHQNNESSKQIKELNAKKAALQIELNEAIAQRDMSEAYVKALNEKLVEVRRELDRKNEELGALKLAQMEAELALTELAEQHGMTVVHLNRMIDELREQLAAEKRAREEVQARKDALQKQIDEFHVNSAKFLRDMNAKISDAKKVYENTDKEIGRLHVAIKKCEQDTISTKQSIEEWKIRHLDTEQVLSQRIAELEAQLKVLLQENEENQVKHDVKKAEVEKIDRECDDLGKMYEENKRAFIRQKNKKQSLEDQCVAVNKEIDKMATPNTKLVEDLEKNKQKMLELLKVHAEEKTTLEMQVYAITAKMKTVYEENCRFQAQINKVEEKLKLLRQQYDTLIRLKAQLRRDLMEHKHNLNRGWEDDQKLNDAFTEAQQVLMRDFDEILGISLQREKCLHRITDRLRRELSHFAVDFRSAVEDTTAQSDPNEDRSGASSASGLRTDSFDRFVASKTLNELSAALVALSDSTTVTQLQPISEEVLTSTTDFTSTQMAASSPSRTNKTRTFANTVSQLGQTPLTEVALTEVPATEELQN